MNEHFKWLYSCNHGTEEQPCRKCFKEQGTELTTSPLSEQIGGDHYKHLKIQPIEYSIKNKLGLAEGNVVKYITRWRNKGGVEDLLKAKHMIDLLIEIEGEDSD